MDTVARFTMQAKSIMLCISAKHNTTIIELCGLIKLNLLPSDVALFNNIISHYVVLNVAQWLRLRITAEGSSRFAAKLPLLSLWANL